MKIMEKQHHSLMKLKVSLKIKSSSRLPKPSSSTASSSSTVTVLIEVTKEVPKPTNEAANAITEFKIFDKQH